MSQSRSLVRAPCRVLRAVCCVPCAPCRAFLAVPYRYAPHYSDETRELELTTFEEVHIRSASLLYCLPLSPLRASRCSPLPRLLLSTLLHVYR